MAKTMFQKFLRAQKIRWRKLYLHYKMRLMRLAASPHAIALGFAIGAFVSVTPLLGLHFILSVIIAWIVRASVIASLISSSVVGNFFFLPFYWLFSYRIGSILLGLNQVKDQDIERLEKISLENIQFSKIFTNTYEFWQDISTLFRDMKSLFHEIFLPTLIGSVILGTFLAILCYIPIYWAVDAYQKQRQKNHKKGDR